MHQNEGTFCGHQKVSYTEKQQFVRQVFSSVADKYDLMNNLMSFGFHHQWKKVFVDCMIKKLIFKKKPIILDVASGSGDIIIKFLKKFLKFNNLGIKAVLSDINEDMLEQAKNKILDENFLQFCDFEVANAENLNFTDSYFDLYTISFGIRNVSNIQKALQEAYRVLKYGSYFLCMEFSPLANNKTIQKIYDLYSQNFIPLIGKNITGDEEAYQYLVDSIQTFPNKFFFKEMMHLAGFKNIDFKILNFGLVVIYIGQKL